MKIIEIKLVDTKSDSVKARADIHFEGFTLKGFKVLQDPKTHKEYVTPPSYRAGPYWRPLFATDTKEDWQEIQKEVLKRYNIQQMQEVIDEQ